MKKKSKIQIHEYTFKPDTQQLRHSIHEIHEADSTKKKEKVIELAQYSMSTKVLLVLNGEERDEEAYIFEKGKMMKVYYREATEAVKGIACLPFSAKSLIDQICEYRYSKFFD